MRATPLVLATILLLAAPGLARAEPFHLAHADFTQTSGHIDVVSDQQARTEPDGERSLFVTRVVLTLGDPDAGGSAVTPSLEQTRYAFDCTAGTFKVLARARAPGLDPSAARADETPPAAAATPVTGEEMNDFRQFACAGPRSLGRRMFGFQEQDLREAVARAADELSRTLTKLMRSAG